ncbi:dTMP kinase [Herbaspirillum sp. C7C2]|uniref:dTMP kinase n=1 Tax=Herbaspirillum sp. C7C2 TaxID=2736666 RepID=UPI001F51E154|nr:dTMP kinase [Herbaspirillum sp. C7C2]MCI1012638.1 dTMP kinase [Herbaspirillum sp. C7C2]
MTQRGLFIVFEGIDGSGTSTQASLLRGRIEKTARSGVLTSEPSEGPVGNMIRQAMKGRVVFSSKPENFDRQMAYLFAADRYDHLSNPIDGVHKFLDSGTTVISTRYFFSSFAYHCATEADWEFIRSLNSNFPNPDLVIYLKNSVDNSIERISNRKHIDVYENREKLKSVLANYERVFNEYTGQSLILDAKEEIETIHGQIWNRVERML